MLSKLTDAHHQHDTREAVGTRLFLRRQKQRCNLDAAPQRRLQGP